MTKLLPNEIACKIPGVEITMPLPVFRIDKIDTTETIPEVERYCITADETFQDGKTYYVEDFSAPHAEPVYKEADDVVVGEKIPNTAKYYEKDDIPEIPDANVSTIYECYTDGMWVDNIPTPEGGRRPVLRAHPIEIIRTKIVNYSDNGSVRTQTEKSHALGLWSQRETLKYVPIFRRVNADAFDESPGMFRL